MLDHISLAVSTLQRSATFYDAVLEPLGYVRIIESAHGVGYGRSGDHGDTFAIRPGLDGFPPPQPMHIAFAAGTREAVIRFYQTAVELGAKSDGEPQLHPEYSAGYFAAFVFDPDGYRVEAVHHESHDSGEGSSSGR